MTPHELARARKTDPGVSAAYFEGREACKAADGWLIQSAGNPYDERTWPALFRAWRAGWNDYYDPTWEEESAPQT